MGTNSDSIVTTKDARAFIEKIARINGPRSTQEVADGDKELAERDKEQRQNTIATLKMISNDLYTNRARFLMEAIQNADDVDYSKHETPTISIKVEPQFVVIECNELGFSEENVRALCRMCQSSKSSSLGHTGEKGIGFKSVFGIANRAHIRSPPYYFQFDKRRELGEITPHWDEKFFEDHEKKEQTTIVLDQISYQSKNFATALQRDLSMIDPLLMLFLRRIERLHITSASGKPAISKRFRCLDRKVQAGVVSIKDEDSGTLHSFYRISHTHPFGGTEDKRPNMLCTDIVLAFPVEKHETSKAYVPFKRESCPVFAHLPIGDFQFKFVIQADFLVTSNRQSVDEDNAWNKNIAEGIAIAFKKAIDDLNSRQSGTDLSNLAKTWLEYIEILPSGLSPYWLSIGESIRRRLQAASVLWNRAGELSMPKHLKFLDWARDRNDEPMLGKANDYISDDYPGSIREELLWLGVTTPSWEWMCETLRKLSDKGILQTRMENDDWCSDLANMILKANSTCTRHKGDWKSLRRIPLIPLTDRTWRCAPSKDDPIYFPVSSGTTIPRGLSISLVNEKACACPARFKLFQSLGVERCEVSDVIEQILDHHAELGSENAMIQQLKYLYKMRKRFDNGCMRKMRFLCSICGHLHKGTRIYADTSATGDLKRLFSGYEHAHFMHSGYFAKLKPQIKAKFTKWLSETAGVAMDPRLATSGDDLHPDFKWLLKMKRGHVLSTLHQCWGSYSKSEKEIAKGTLADEEFKCRSGQSAALEATYLPLPELIRRAGDFGNADEFNFLELPSGKPKDWMFLSNLGVGAAEGLEFYLWVLEQLMESSGIQKAKQLYLAIQSCVSPNDYQKIRESFHEVCIDCLPGQEFANLKDCVWNGPQGFSSKPALLPVYDDELAQLFKQILKVPDVTTEEILEYLKQLKDDKTTTMTDVVEAYVFLHENCKDSWEVEDELEFLAVPISKSRFEWKSRAQCVWSDDEFSQNGLHLKSKIAIRDSVKKHARAAECFFTEYLGIPDAGIEEMLDDLKLMQEQRCNDTERIHCLYKRIESFSRKHSEAIKDAFESHPLVFNSEGGRWLSLTDCIWKPSILRGKYALRPILGKYHRLFRKTLKVPNATTEMLVKDLLKTTKGDPMKNLSDYQHAKKLLEKIDRLSDYGDELEPLDGKAYWPCHTPKSSRKFCSIGNFFVNDRQDLFEIFGDRHTFLDFDFQTTRMVTGLLRSQECDSFLSTCVSVETSPHGPLELNDTFTEDFKARAGPLATFFKHTKCESFPKLQRILRRAKVWNSACIERIYMLEGDTQKRGGAGSHVEVSIRDKTPMLDIYYSVDKAARDCARIEDFPKQFVAALKLNLGDISELRTLLQVPSDSMKAVLTRSGITAGGNKNGHIRTVVTDSSDEEREEQSVHSTSTASVVIESTRAWSRPKPTTPAMKPFLNHRHSSDSVVTEDESQCSAIESSTEGLCERPAALLATPATIYNARNRNRNRDRVLSFARKAASPSNPQKGGSSQPSSSRSSVFDMRLLENALEATAKHSPSVTRAIQKDTESAQERSRETRASDKEIGFLGEHFVFSWLQDKVRLPNFTGEDNWTSSLRSRAGFSKCGDKEADFIYRDEKGALTRHFLQMQHPYETPKWLSTVCTDGNAPVYQIEVKSTPREDHTATFYMSIKQHRLEKRLQVKSAKPSEIYVIIRVSSLNALEDGSKHQPQMRVYLDPYTCSKEGILKSVIQKQYAVKATR